MYLSLATDGSLANLGAYADEDILGWNGTNYTMFFDGSVAGLPASADIWAFDIQPTRILMSFGQDTQVPGVGLVRGSDIVAWDRTPAAGGFSLFFQGSVVGLQDLNGEALDAFDVLPDGRLVVSTRANPVVGVTGAQDEDLIAFTPTNPGVYTSGSWAMYFDASDVGLTLSAEGIDAAAVRGTDIYLSTNGAFTTTSGFTGAGADVFVCHASSLGTTTACTFNTFFIGGAHGLTGLNVDAMDLP